jgi:hypothetical protein
VQIYSEQLACFPLPVLFHQFTEFESSFAQCDRRSAADPAAFGWRTAQPDATDCFATARMELVLSLIDWAVG